MNRRMVGQMGRMKEKNKKMKGERRESEKG